MDINTLGKTILFKEMSEDEIKSCLKELRSHEKKYKKGSIIFHAGDQTDRMGLVLNGSVTIESNDMWGNCTILTHVPTGQFFAETYALLPGEVMLVDVKANEDCLILFITVGNIFLEATSSSWKEKLTRNLLIISTHKNLTLSGRSFHTASKSARGRILSYLNTVSIQKQSSEFDIPYDRQQLADYLNLERTNMSKELGKMQREGILEFSKSHFKLINHQKNNIFTI